MKIKDILNKLNEMAPFSLALSYDNSGFLIGDSEGDVKKAIVALDCTPAVVDEAIKEKAELIITHHPVIFDPLKSVTAQSNKVVYSCLANKIAVISVHTNLDSADGGVNDSLANALELKNIQKIEGDEGFLFRYGELENTMSADELAERIKIKLGGVVRYTNSLKPIKTVAVCGGSGGDFLELAMNKADAFITADVKHKLLIKASANDYSLFDAGHFHTEDTVIEPFVKALADKMPSVLFKPYHLGEIKTK